MSDQKAQREAYIRASEQRVANWTESKREAFQKAVSRMTKPQASSDRLNLAPDPNPQKESEADE